MLPVSTFKGEKKEVCSWGPDSTRVQGGGSGPGLVARGKVRGPCRADVGDPRVGGRVQHAQGTVQWAER